MSLIDIKNLTFCYDSSYDNVFENVSFRIDTDWRLGFTGRNGRGKTTFLKLLLGKYEYSGKISASVHFDYFPFEIPDNSLLTIDIVDSICHDYEQWQLYRELSLLDVAEDVLYRTFITLSNGEQTKVLLAVLFLKENNFLLIDEPTNHLDTEARATVSRYLKSKNGYILVSHDRGFLDNCIDHILSINKQNIEIQKGNFSSWLVNKERQDEFELAENKKLLREVKQLSAAAKRAATWSNEAENRKIGFDPSKTEKNMGRRAYEGEKSRKMMKRSKAIEQRRENAVDEKAKLLKNLERAQSLTISPLPHHAKRLVEAVDLSISYGEKSVCDKVSFTISQGNRLALCGKNGSGKSSIIKALLGFETPPQYHLSGTLTTASNLIISYVAQDTSFLQGTLTDFAEECSINQRLFFDILIKLDFSPVQFEKKIEDYSGGQKKKVLIARSLCEKAHLYIWDEPLNFIDVLSRMQIENLILQYQPTMLFVEHDTEFCKNVATGNINL